MYLESVQVNNFKCFAEQELRFSKITLLLGANSTGKTSLLYSLLAALQSDRFPVVLSANGAWVNLGDFRAISHKHKSDAEVQIRLSFGGHEHGTATFSGRYTQSSKTGMPELHGARYSDQSFAVDVVRDSHGYKTSWTYDSAKDPFRKSLSDKPDLRAFFQAVNKFMRAGKGKQSNASITDGEDWLGEPPSSGEFSFTNTREFLKRLSEPKYFLLTPHLTSLTTTLSEYQRGFNYVGSFRQEPQRSYYQVSKADLKVRRDGQNYIEQIATWQEEGAPQLSQLKKALRQLKLLEGLRASRIGRGIFEVSVRPSLRGVPAALADVGFGVGQILPLLVADLQLPNTGTLAISQPEIHLHPSVQADLADYFAKRISVTKKRYVIETHSEYLFNRLRLLVAKGDLKAADLSILFLASDGSKTVAHPITFATDGRIEGAPKEFFQTYMADVMNIAIAAH